MGASRRLAVVRGQRSGAAARRSARVVRQGTAFTGQSSARDALGKVVRGILEDHLGRAPAGEYEATPGALVPIRGDRQESGTLRVDTHESAEDDFAIADGPRETLRRRRAQTDPLRRPAVRALCASGPARGLFHCSSTRTGPVCPAQQPVREESLRDVGCGVRKGFLRSPASAKPQGWSWKHATRPAVGGRRKQPAGIDGLRG